MAKVQADQADQANNKLNAKRPDIGAMLSANQSAAAGGGAGTMLTGVGGVDPSTLQLGKNTLLGS
jgi:alanine dehydrogenase